jgi:hypothetical protein
VWRGGNIQQFLGERAMQKFDEFHNKTIEKAAVASNFVQELNRVIAANGLLTNEQ